MANILDIFRTHTGNRLLRRSEELTGQKREELLKSFQLLFPLLLGLLRSKKEIGKPKMENLTSYIEKAELLSDGSKLSVTLFSNEELNAIANLSKIYQVDSDNFKKCIYISTAVLSGIINSILGKNPKATFTEVIGTIAGDSSKFDKSFVQILVKNSDSPNFINSSEEIALNPESNNDDESILGGFTGGK